MNEELVGLLSMAWILGCAALLVLVWHLRASRRQHRLDLIHRERLAAIEKGVPLPELPDYGDGSADSPLAEALARLRLDPRWPLGAGAVCIMLGIGTSLALALSGDEYHNQVWPFGLIAVFFGLGLWLHYVLAGRRTR